MTWLGNRPSATPLTQEQMAAGDKRFPKLDGANVPVGLFKNAFINGSFDHWQRGTTFGPGIYAIAYYTADRWAVLTNAAGSAITATRQTVPVPGGDPQLPGSESQYYMRVAYSGSAGLAGEIAQFRQPIEGVSRFAGRRVVVRGYARRVGGVDTNIALIVNQNFGIGGSASVNTPGGKIALTSTFKPFALVVDVPSIAGKILGYGNMLIPIFALSAGSDYNVAASNLGTQNVTVDFADVEIREVIPGYGDQLPPFERVPPDVEWLRCQRYYQSYEHVTVSGTAASAGAYSAYAGFSIPQMRVAPTMVVTQNTNYKASAGVVANDITQRYIRLVANSTGGAVDIFYAIADITLTAEL